MKFNNYVLLIFLLSEYEKKLKEKLSKQCNESVDEIENEMAITTRMYPQNGYILVSSEG